MNEKKGPVIRITPTMLLVNDTDKLPDIYHRYTHKSKHYITGSFGKDDSLFTIQDWQQHAYFRKILGGPVCDYLFSSSRPQVITFVRSFDLAMKKIRFRMKVVN